MPPLPSQAPQYAPQPEPAQAVTEPAPPPAAGRVYVYPSGQWVYTEGYGWVWVPAGSSTTVVEGTPYTYLYTPSYGWTWYVSPWGWGPYRYGAWVVHPWRPVGWRGGWVAHPQVVVHLGAHPYYHGGYAHPVVVHGGYAHPVVVHGGYAHPVVVHGGGHRR
jgi:hypothetical protein